jgi:hypothetical protein
LDAGKLIRYLILGIFLFWGVIDSSSESASPCPEGSSINFGFRIGPGFPLASGKFFFQYQNEATPGERLSGSPHLSYSLEFSPANIVQLAEGLPFSAARILYRSFLKSDEIHNMGGMVNE